MATEKDLLVFLGGGGVDEFWHFRLQKASS